LRPRAPSRRGDAFYAIGDAQIRRARDIDAATVRQTTESSRARQPRTELDPDEKPDERDTASAHTLITGLYTGRCGLTDRFGGPLLPEPSGQQHVHHSVDHVHKDGEQKTLGGALHEAAEVPAMPAVSLLLGCHRSSL
jgi:hypothetical protein